MSVKSDNIGIFCHDPVLQKREKRGVRLSAANGMDLVAEVRVEVIIEAIWCYRFQFRHPEIFSFF